MKDQASLDNNSTDDIPEQEHQTYRVRTQLLSKGRSDYILANTDLMTIRIKCYAQGGENVLHAHPGEDHSFIVLAGKARFFDKQGRVSELTRNEGIMLRRGVYYKFQSCGDEPLVLLRVGAEKEKVPVRRVGVSGDSLPGKSKANKHEEGVPIDGTFYE